MSLAGYRRRIHVSNGGVLLTVYLLGVERGSTLRPKTSVIQQPTAAADARNQFGGRFCSRIHSPATSMVHLRPILAICRRSCLPCFIALGFLLFGFVRPHLFGLARLLASALGQPLSAVLGRCSKINNGEANIFTKSKKTFIFNGEYLLNKISVVPMSDYGWSLQ